MENQPQATTPAAAGRTPEFEAWMQARKLRLDHMVTINKAVLHRPPRSSPDWDKYQEENVRPLVAERDRLRAAEEKAKMVMNAKRADVKG